MQGPDEGRTLTQLRADNAATWLLGGTGTAETDDVAGAGGGGSADATGSTGGSTGSSTGSSGLIVTGGTGTALVAGSGNQDARGVPTPRAQVLVTVPVMALLGKTEEPAVLDGYGPIPPSMARRLIADGAESFHRVLIDPRDGAPLEIGRSSYRVSKAQRQWLRLRDGKCPFPGCSNQSLDNEADHVLAWAEGGATGDQQPRPAMPPPPPTPPHHRLDPRQTSKNEPPGWTSPAGRHYNSEHPHWEPPHWPEELFERVEPAQPAGHPDQKDREPAGHGVGPAPSGSTAATGSHFTVLAFSCS